MLMHHLKIDHFSNVLTEIFEERLCMLLMNKDLAKFFNKKHETYHERTTILVKINWDTGKFLCFRHVS